MPAHTAAATQDLLATLGWKQFDHLPYSPDLATSDFRVFLHLKSIIGGWQSKKLVKRDLHRRWHHSMMQG
jgi:hypothetical protein